MTDQPHSTFSHHGSPRTWLLSSGLSPIAVRLARLLLAQGDQVVSCLPYPEVSDEDRGAEFNELTAECESDRQDREGWRDRLRTVRGDGRVIGSCSAAVSGAVRAFGTIDVLLCCRSESVVGTVEELSTTPITQNLVREQFDAIFFSQVNFIKATLPQLRAQNSGHIVALTSTGGEIGTPGMSMYTAATWAMEGYCDSLAYEVAPFNIKVTIIQPDQEIQILTNKIIMAPPLAIPNAATGQPPNIRDMLLNVLNSDPVTAVDQPAPEMALSVETTSKQAIEEPVTTSLDPDSSQGKIVHRYARLSSRSLDALVTETVHAIAAIGAHDNPPSRHIVGWEGAAAVKEKLRTVTEEMEDFVDASLAVDISESELKEQAREWSSKT